MHFAKHNMVTDAVQKFCDSLDWTYIPKPDGDLFLDLLRIRLCRSNFAHLISTHQIVLLRYHSLLSDGFGQIYLLQHLRFREVYRHDASIVRGDVRDWNHNSQICIILRTTKLDLAAS